MNREKTHQKDRPPFYQLQGRTGDIDDLIFNTLGMLGGHFLGTGYSRLVRRKAREQGS